MKKNKYVQLLFQICVSFLIFTLIDYMIEKEFRFIRNTIISVPVSTFLFFMNRKNDIEK